MTPENLQRTNSCFDCEGTGRIRVGKVTPAERDEIRFLFERKNGLIELFRSLTTLSTDELAKSPLYERLVSDIGDVSTRFQRWWDDMSVQYSWKRLPDYRWEINFDSCEVYLHKPE